MKGAEGEVLAQIDRDWRGFGFEVFVFFNSLACTSSVLFLIENSKIAPCMCVCVCVIQILTDAGQYVIRFGKSDAASKSGPATMVCSTFVSFWLLFTLTMDI